ncbi:MAG: HD domain-containing protein [Candidatus Pacebacteria bacterium]|nr:HD domain-containing protein [Candidatus Paceibacterota bacterium]
MEDIKKFVSFLHQAGKMKTALRFSEISNMPRDSAAEHSWRAAFMGFLVIDEFGIKLNKERALKMALAHDIVEIVVGNIDYISIVQKKISKKSQQALEKKAIEKIKKSLPQKSGKEVFNLWTEYEKGQTKEAKFVKAINKLETLAFLSEIGYKYFDKPDLIVHYADEAVKNFPALQNLFLQIKLGLKAEFKKGNIQWKK